ncbi:unnamed protein product (macronuclear) [Paramecium tetraurelia]|uniref:Uncharacterized protein n=1 Tax=Paramecium tetraurelia TaxID=5888 RepID=A0CMS5_PARTE|nr:uncharacterized protein GSPATT00008571001 [Paramecium tetraurelia]CAK72092.1 unnamed protein product [Paramecium tetraurelia]|eukprot:XP_001439489.1 hypothetical protein (macronuclear) [Paramecium tetraurelia strain d4-2]
MQNLISQVKCKMHLENEVQFVCMSTECIAPKLCCLNCQEMHDMHHSLLKNLDQAWEEILQHKQKQNEVQKDFENLWSQMSAFLTQWDRIIDFNKLLVRLEKELTQSLTCQELLDMIQKYEDLSFLLEEKAKMIKNKYCHFDKDSKLEVDVMLALFNEARQLKKKGDKINAIDKYSQVLEMNENFIVARLDRGKLNMGQNYEQAQFDFEEVLKQDDLDVRALKGLAVCQKMKCNYGEGLYYALRGQKLKQISPQLHFHLADCCKFEGKSQEALHFINIAIEQKKRKYENKMKIFYKNKAEIHLELNDLQNANIFINKALEIYQNYELAINIKERINKIARAQNVIL